MLPATDSLSIARSL